MGKPENIRPETFRSIENMEAVLDGGKAFARSDMVVIEKRIFGPQQDHMLVLLADPKGRGWYETKVLKGQVWTDQEEAIFGRRIRQKRRPA